jgi:hypothetical protein
VKSSKTVTLQKGKSIKNPQITSHLTGLRLENIAEPMRPAITTQTSATARPQAIKAKSPMTIKLEAQRHFATENPTMK